MGENPLHREKLYQMLYKGRRWLYQEPGSFGDFDNCLWDITGKAAGLPVYALIGKVRDRFPVYLTGMDGDVDYYSREIEAGKEAGIKAYKFHSYKGGKADIPLWQTMRMNNTTIELNGLGGLFGLVHAPGLLYRQHRLLRVPESEQGQGGSWPCRRGMGAAQRAAARRGPPDATRWSGLGCRMGRGPVRVAGGGRVLKRSVPIEFPTHAGCIVGGQGTGIPPGR